MELSIIRRETTGSPPNQYNESETITKFEIMDGAPVRGETIPIRLFLGGFDLTPTFRDVNKRFSTRYYLNLVLIDEENRRYFKQQVREFTLSISLQVSLMHAGCAQEITIFRIPEVRSRLARLCCRNGLTSLAIPSRIEALHVALYDIDHKDVPTP
jgi:hypothetical protein